MQTDKQTNEFFSYDPPYSRGNNKNQCLVAKRHYSHIGVSSNREN